MADNLNSITKTHRDCLLDIDPYTKIKVSREEYEAVSDQLEKIYLKMEEKLMKETICRNANIKKTIE